MSTNVPFPSFTDAGFQAPSSEDIFAGVMADIDQAFGGGLNLDPEEPQGQLGVSFTECVKFFQDLFVLYTQRVDPSYSSGRMQDAIGRLYFLERIPAAPTTVVATLTGAVGTIIPAGALARTAGGDVYQALSSATIPVGGSIDVEFANVAPGPVACPVGYLSAIYQAIPGWDTITNAADGVIGNDVESPTAFEARRAASVARNADGVLDAVRAVVRDTPGVIDCYVTENDTGAPVTRGAVTLDAHSLYVAVYGGTDDDVARAIWSRKPPGCGYTGSTSIVVEDTAGGYSLPYPSYTVKFDRAALLPVAITVTLANGPQVPADVAARVQAAVQTVFAGTDASGSGRPSIGGRLYGNRFYAPISGLGPWAQIASIELGVVGGGIPSASFLDVEINQLPSISAADISVVLV